MSLKKRKQLVRTTLFPSTTSVGLPASVLIVLLSFLCRGNVPAPKANPSMFFWSSSLLLNHHSLLYLNIGATSVKKCFNTYPHPFDPTSPPSQHLFPLHPSEHYCLKELSGIMVSMSSSHFLSNPPSLPWTALNGVTRGHCIPFLFFYLKYQLGCFQLNVAECPIKKGLNNRDIYCSESYLLTEQEGSQVDSAVL